MKNPATSLKPLHKPIKVAMIGGGVNSAVGRVHEIAMKMDNEFDLVAGDLLYIPNGASHPKHLLGRPQMFSRRPKRCLNIL